MGRDYPAWTALIEARSAFGFGYGREPQTQDCVRFAAAAVQALTGRDPLAEISARWTTARGARRVLRRLGGLGAGVDLVLRPVPLAMARRGDVALVRIGEAESLMVIEGDTLVGPAEPRGLQRLARASAARAWSAD